MENITLPLPPNKTHACREATWERLPLDPLTGVLSITESVKPTTKVYVSRYLVAELPEVTPGHRRFRFTKPGGVDQHFVETGEEFPRCQCHGWMSHGTCKHTQSVEALDAAGLLEPEGVTA